MSNIKEKVEERKFLYKRVPKVENFRQIQVSSIDHTYGVDLIDYTGNNQGNNRGYILVVVDYHSRFSAGCMCMGCISMVNVYTKLF